MPAEIVPFRLAQLESLHACLDAVARERVWLARLEAGPIEGLREFVGRNLASDAALFVAVDEGRVVGWCDIVSPSIGPIKHRGTVGIGVLASHRGAGLGQRLLSAAIEKCDANGVTRIELEVRAGNARAIELYRRLGFEHESTRRGAILIDGRYSDAWTMARLHASIPRHQAD
ncbi:GNAT family protein [soil metagenome]